MRPSTPAAQWLRWWRLFSCTPRPTRPHPAILPRTIRATNKPRSRARSGHRARRRRNHDRQALVGTADGPRASDPPLSLEPRSTSKEALAPAPPNSPPRARERSPAEPTKSPSALKSGRSRSPSKVGRSRLPSKVRRSSGLTTKRPIMRLIGDPNAHERQERQIAAGDGQQIAHAHTRKPHAQQRGRAEKRAQRGERQDQEHVQARKARSQQSLFDSVWRSARAPRALWVWLGLGLTHHELSVIVRRVRPAHRRRRG